MDFKFTDQDMKAFHKLMENAPFAMQKVSANALNELGDLLKVEIVKELSRDMTIRNRTFLPSQIMVFKTSPGRAIDSQNVIVGSRHTETFSGWRENETGGESERNRVIMMFARGGDKAKIVPKSMRINSEIAHNDGNFGIAEGNRVFGFLAWLGRVSYAGMFELKGKQFSGGYYKLIAGTWKMKSKRHKARGGGFREWEMPKFKKVQQKDEHIQVGAKHWMQRSVTNLMGNTDYEKLWERALIEAIERAKEKL